MMLVMVLGYSLNSFFFVTWLAKTQGRRDWTREGSYTIP